MQRIEEQKFMQKFVVMGCQVVFIIIVQVQVFVLQCSGNLVI